LEGESLTKSTENTKVHKDIFVNLGALDVFVAKKIAQ
jgi:hypothetical protein